MEVIRCHPDIERNPCIGHSHVLGSELGRWRKSECVDIIEDNISREKSRSIFAINIHDSHFFDVLSDTVLVEILEEEELGIHIVVHRLMEIEVILTDIGEDCDIIAKSIDTIVVERMARCLHDEIVTPSIASTTDKVPNNKW